MINSNNLHIVSLRDDMLEINVKIRNVFLLSGTHSKSGKHYNQEHAGAYGDPG